MPAGLSAKAKVPTILVKYRPNGSGGNNRLVFEKNAYSASRVPKANERCGSST